MRKKRRLILLAVIVLAIGGVAYKVGESIWAAKAREIRKNPLKALDYVPQAALKIKDFRRAKIEDGRKIWELFGDEAEYLKEQKEAVIKKPRFFFYDKKGETIEATGDEGHMYFSEKELEKMQFQGGIRVVYQGFVLKSDEAFYYPKTDQIIMPGKVTLVGDGLELEGVRMEVTLENQKMRLLRNVKTKLQPEKLNKKKDKSKAGQVSGG